MFNKILIANRGEIAVRIIRACKELGIMTVAVFSEIDRDALHTQLADEAVCIGGNKPSESYLNMHNIISAAFLTKSQAIHPGFGFLAENSIFASMCKECNIKFIGPDPETIELMGNKSNARSLMKKNGVRVIPGSDGIVSGISTAKKFSKEYGYPIVIKASSGGGGKGIRVVHNDQELEHNFYAAKNEAKNAFGDDSVYIEKLLQNTKHIEVQILADNFGNIIHLGERDCSLQRKKQKFLEEAPCFLLDQKIRKDLGNEAVKVAKACDYKNAGTVEFLYDSKGNFYFMEMNTRIQVEHPITEMITNIDIIKEQIKIAFGCKLDIKQKNIIFDGHSIECRINAEDPKNNFAPQPGKINYLYLSGGCLGVRIDSSMYAGYTIPPFYDSMIAKIITHGKDRSEAISKMKRVLSEIIIDDILTNIDFQLEILNDKNFESGNITTSYIDDLYFKKNIT